MNLFGNHASNESEGSHEIDKVSLGDDYLTLSYKDDIIPWLKQCRTLAIEKPYVREIIGLYIDTLNSLIDDNMNMAEKEELFNYMEKHIEASAEIILVGKDFMPYLFNKYIIPSLITWAEGNGLIYKTYGFSSGGKYTGISFYKEEWTRKLSLEFQEANFGDLICGITGEKTTMPISNTCLIDLKNPNDKWHYGYKSLKRFKFREARTFPLIKNHEVSEYYVAALEDLYQAVQINEIIMSQDN